MPSVNSQKLYSGIVCTLLPPAHADVEEDPKAKRVRCELGGSDAARSHTHTFHLVAGTTCFGADCYCAPAPRCSPLREVDLLTKSSVGLQPAVLLASINMWVTLNNQSARPD